MAIIINPDSESQFVLKVSVLQSAQSIRDLSRRLPAESQASGTMDTNGTAAWGDALLNTVTPRESSRVPTPAGHTAVRETTCVPGTSPGHLEQA